MARKYIEATIGFKKDIGKIRISNDDECFWRSRFVSAYGSDTSVYKLRRFEHDISLGNACVYKIVGRKNVCGKKINNYGDL